MHQRRLESCRPMSADAPQVSEQVRQTESAHNDIDVASQLKEIQGTPEACGSSPRGPRERNSLS